MNSDRMHCYICEEVLSPNSSLENHVETVHGDKEYEHECNICTKRFSNAANLQTHINRVHKSKKVQAPTFE